MLLRHLSFDSVVLFFSTGYQGEPEPTWFEFIVWSFLQKNAAFLKIRNVRVERRLFARVRKGQNGQCKQPILNAFIT